jgi:hypothetical protein
MVLGLWPLLLVVGPTHAQTVLTSPEKGQRSVVLQPSEPGAPPLTVTMQASPPAPIIMRAARDNDDAKQAALAQFDVELSLNGAQLWAGPLRAGWRMGANMDQTIRQPYEVCGSNGDMAQERDSDAQRISLRIDQVNERQEPDSFRVTVSVTRPIPACEGGGSLTLGFTRSPTIMPGRSVVLDGDGKLKVSLLRRR